MYSNEYDEQRVSIKYECPSEVGENMDLSIIVPVYNTDLEKLARCFGSIKKLCDFRVGTEIECIIVDDGSTSDIGRYCSDFAEKNKYFIYIRKDNGGVSSARNLGMKKACGSYISFVDSDDVVEIGGYTDVYFSMDCDLLFTDLVLQSGRHTETWNAFNKAEGLVTILDVLLKISNDGKLNGPVCKRIKRRFLEKNDIHFHRDLISGEDAFFLMDMLRYNPTMYYIPVANYRYLFDNQTSKERLFCNIELVLNNNKALYGTMLELIEWNEGAGKIGHTDANYLTRKSMERYIKQIFNIAAALSRNHNLFEDTKRLVLESMLLVKTSGHLIAGKQSRFQYRTIVEGRWITIYVYSLIRELYLTAKKTM